MKVKKKSLKLRKIIIDIVLCPKTSLYLQNFYCHKCAYFISDVKNHISCSYKKPQNANQKKEELIKIFSKIKGVSSQHLVDISDDHIELLLDIKKRIKSIVV
ncbi:MAG: hypothetical protein ACTSP9_16675 [Promethearchaeota archaeon]